MTELREKLQNFIDSFDVEISKFYQEDDNLSKTQQERNYGRADGIRDVCDALEDFISTLQLDRGKELKPLSEITDEDAIHIYKMTQQRVLSDDISDYSIERKIGITQVVCLNTPDEYLTINNDDLDIRRWFYDGTKEAQASNEKCNYLQAYVYLISKGYDINKLSLLPNRETETPKTELLNYIETTLSAQSKLGASNDVIEVLLDVKYKIEWLKDNKILSEETKCVHPYNLVITDENTGGLKCIKCETKLTD